MEATREHVKDQKHRQSQTVCWGIFIFSAFLALTGLFCAPQLEADIYQWVDENGVKHYSNEPPDNAGNAKKVFDELQHDEAADQKRVESDQKMIDGLIEKIKNEEPQVRLDKQMKVEEAIPYQPPLSAVRCFSPSYSLRMGMGMRQALVPRELMPGEYEDLQKLFESLNGGWSGVGWSIDCQESQGELRKEMDNYSIRSDGRMRSRGKFVLKSTLHSRKNNFTEDKIIRLNVNPQRLSSATGRTSDIELLSVSSDELVYVEKHVRNRQTTSGNLISEAHETLTAIKKTGEVSFSLERSMYLNGRLKTLSTWDLENK